MYSEKLPEPFVVYRSIGAAGERYGIGVIKRNSGKEFFQYFHDAYRLVFLLQEKGCCKDQAGNLYELKPGSVIHCFADVPLEWSIQPDEKDYVECFIEPGSCMAELLQLTMGTPPGIMDQSQKLHDLVNCLLNLRNLFLNGNENQLIVCLPQILAFILELSGCELPLPPQEKYHSIIEKSCLYLAENFDAVKNVKEFCRKNSIGYENFRKIFKQKIGTAPHQYHIRRRIDAACSMLLSTQFSIAEIAQKLGYHTTFEFSAQFRQITGVSPSKFRKLRTGK